MMPLIELYKYIKRCSDLSNKELIFSRFPLLERAGGPPTYLYNLYRGLQEITGESEGSTFRQNKLEIKFITGQIRKAEGLARKHSVKLKNLSGSVFPSFLAYDFYQGAKNFIFRREIKELKAEIRESNSLYLNTVLDYPVLKPLASNNQTKLLTIHSPESIVKEFSKYSLLAKAKLQVSQIERAAINWTDVFIYPCEEALEAHFKVFPYLEELVKRKRVIFYPSGVQKLQISTPKGKIRKQLGIPEDAFVVSFLGRHIEVKGFDLLIQALSKLNQGLEAPRIHLLSAGKGHLLQEYGQNPLLRRFWHHLEWTNFPGDLVNASDLFVLANRKSFFDLVLLETMSIGKPIISTDVGGLRFITRSSKGIICIRPTVNDLMDSIFYVYSSNLETRARMAKENLSSYEKNYSLTAFALNHLNAVAAL